MTKLAVPLAAVLAAAGMAWSPSAYAGTGLVDVHSGDCTYSNATTSDVPPNTLTIDFGTAQQSCDPSGMSAVTNNPTVTFDDAGGTATMNEIDSSGTVLGVSCSYKATGLVFDRQDTTRSYIGGPYTATLTGGSFLCPATESIGSVTLFFH